jgi:hypothetical protein
MFRDLLSNRGIQFGLIFSVLIILSSLLYYWHVQRDTQAELAASDLLIQDRGHHNKTRPTTGSIDTSPVGFEHAEKPLETDNAPVGTNGTALLDAAPIDLSDAFLSDDFVSQQEASTEEAPVSPFGFGPYPEVPVGFPEHLSPVWTWSDRYIVLFCYHKGEI